jgi:hypothetical protein
MQDICPVLQKLGGGVFHVAAWAAATTGVADDLQLVFSRIAGKPAPPFTHGAEAFAPAAIAITGTDDDSDSYRLDLALRPGVELNQL